MIDGWGNNTKITKNGVMKARSDKFFIFKNSRGIDVDSYIVEYKDLDIYLVIRGCKGCNLVSASFGSSMIDDVKKLSEKYKILGFHLPNDDELAEYRDNLCLISGEWNWSEHWTYKHNYISGQIYRQLVLVSDFELEEI